MTRSSMDEDRSEAPAQKVEAEQRPHGEAPQTQVPFSEREVPPPPRKRVFLIVLLVVGGAIVAPGDKLRYTVGIDFTLKAPAVFIATGVAVVLALGRKLLQPQPY